EGREGGPLGYPVSAVQVRSDGSWIQVFQGGCIVDSSGTTTRTVWGIRWTRWVAAGRETGVLGYPVGAVEVRADASWIQVFEHGCIIDSAATTTRVVRDAVWTAWGQVGRETGVLGYPTTEQEDVPGGSTQGFERGGIWG